MQRRFIVQFLFQITFLSILLFVCLLTAIGALGYYLSDSEFYHDLHKADDYFLDNVINYNDGEWELKKKFKEAVRTQEGWVVIYDEEGHVLYQYNVPPDEPIEYKLLLQDMPYVETSFQRVEPMSDEPFIVAYSSRKKAEATLKDILENFDFTQNELPSLTSEAIIYYINDAGEMLDAINPLSKKVTIDDVLELQSRGKYETASFKDDVTHNTIIVAFEQPVWDDTDFIMNFKTPFYIGLIVMFIFLIISTLFYAKKFGSPLLIMIEWIRQLNDKNYDIPVNKKGQHLLTNKKGKLKRKYKLYKELFETLEGVTLTLKKNEEQQQVIEKTREEWITSLSHDLKTPLSTIIGYVKMLQSSHNWTKEERTQFYNVMDEKSEYMMSLIEDLTLTYRLKNEQLPIDLQRLDINEIIRRTLIQLLNNRQLKDYTFDFHTNCEVIVAMLDLKWFQRILDNLLVNATKHNPAGTTISIETQQLDHAIIITIRDDGVGMDAATIEHLFNRYYRGTNTTEVLEGTGLGMAITKQLILMQGGTIDVTSDIGTGTSVNVTFSRIETVS